MGKIVIIGTSTAAKNVFCFIKKYNLFDIIGFAVDRDYKTEDSFCDLPIFTTDSLDAIIDKENDYLFVAIQWNNLNSDRKKVYCHLKSQGYKFANLISPTAIINGRIEGDNCWISDCVIIDFDAVIKNNVYLKIGAFIADGVSVENHSFIGARSIIAGGVKIGEQSFVGVGSVIFDNVKVGKKCIVGAATALKRNLEDFSVYKTQQDSYTVKQYTEAEIESKLQFKKNVR